MENTSWTSSDGEDAERVALFERHRARLFGIAYRMLGSVDDASDVVQDAYLRWHRADLAVVREPEAWLVAVTTRLSIDRARAASVERERYVGPWLPEPIATSAASAASAPDRAVEIASDLSMAFMVLLERLAPEERAAFLLREVFDAEYDEIARVLEKTEIACRQIVHRARQRVRADRARFDVDVERKEQLVRRFIAALETSDQEAVLALVSDDVEWVSDGGGRVSAFRRVVRGADRVVRMIAGLERKAAGRTRHELGWANGEPVIMTYALGQLYCTTSIAVEGDRVVAFYRVLNPDKLARLAR